jgi:hypothetical protein
MREIVQSVAAGQLPRDSGLALLSTTLALTTEQAEAIMGSAGREALPRETLLA